MPGIAPRLRIDAPASPPRAYSLLSSVTVLPFPDAHGENGLTWDPESCLPSESWEVSCTSTVDKLDGDNTGAFGAPVETDPFVVYAVAECSVSGGYSLEELAAIAQRKLAAGESYAVERAFWTGDPAVSRSLQGATDLTPAGGPLSITSGIATLESWASQNIVGRATLHMAPGVVPYANALRQLESSSGRLRIPGTGSAVVVGAGYDVNESPAGVVAPAGEAWIFVTAEVTVHRSEVYTAEARDVHQNDQAAFAERTYSIGYPCFAAAVRVELTCACC